MLRDRLPSEETVTVILAGLFGAASIILRLMNDPLTLLVCLLTSILALTFAGLTLWHGPRRTHRLAAIVIIVVTIAAMWRPLQIAAHF